MLKVRMEPNGQTKKPLLFLLDQQESDVASEVMEGLRDILQISFMSLGEKRLMACLESSELVVTIPSLAKALLERPVLDIKELSRVADETIAVLSGLAAACRSTQL